MSILEKNNSDIQKLCVHHKVKRLYAFGSVLTNEFDNDSDVDFIVDFEPLKIEDYADNYFDLKSSLQDILARSVDLLEEKALRNPYFIQSISQTRKLVYAHDL